MEAIAPWILQAVEKLKIVFQPEKIILFGSHADHTASRRSDLDLLIIASTTLRPLQRIERALENLIDLPCPVDVIVYTPTEMNQNTSTFIRHILLTGVVIYESEKTTTRGKSMVQDSTR